MNAKAFALQAANLLLVSELVFCLKWKFHSFGEWNFERLYRKLGFNLFFDDYLSFIVQFTIQPECSVR